VTERTKSRVGSVAELWLVEQVIQRESVGGSPPDSRSRSFFATGYMTFECCWCLAKKDQMKGGKFRGGRVGLEDVRGCRDGHCEGRRGGWEDEAANGGLIYLEYFSWNAAKPEVR
jgi:hypothetical protein